MDKEDITRAAEEAVKDLQLDCAVTDITRPMGKNTWCIQFSGSYGQFCDEFQDKAGKENSARLMREKIKRFFLKQRKPTRIVRGRTPSTRSSAVGEENLLGTLLRVGEQAIKQASRITSEVVERATNLNEAVLKSQADMLEGISPTAAAVLRPEGGGSAGLTQGPPPQRIVEPVSHQSIGPVAPERRAGATAAGQTAAEAKGATPKRAAKDSRSRATTKATKKAAAKKSAKGTSGKKGVKAAARKTSSKKSAAKTRR
jgi:hypothetical protein